MPVSCDVTGREHVTRGFLQWVGFTPGRCCNRVYTYIPRVHSRSVQGHISLSYVTLNAYCFFLCSPMVPFSHARFSLGLGGLHAIFWSQMLSKQDFPCCPLEGKLNMQKRRTCMNCIGRFSLISSFANAVKMRWYSVNKWNIFVTLLMSMPVCHDILSWYFSLSILSRSRKDHFRNVAQYYF